MARRNRILEADSPPTWKVWAITIIGASAALSISILVNPGADKAMADPDAQSGYVVGQGLAFGAVAAAAAYFLLLKKTTKAKRNIALTVIVAAGIAGAVLTNG